MMLVPRSQTLPRQWHHSHWGQHALSACPRVGTSPCHLSKYCWPHTCAFRRYQVRRLIPSAIQGLRVDIELVTYCCRGTAPDCRRRSACRAFFFALRCSANASGVISTGGIRHTSNRSRWAFVRLTRCCISSREGRTRRGSQLNKLSMIGANSNSGIQGAKISISCRIFFSAATGATAWRRNSKSRASRPFSLSGSVDPNAWRHSFRKSPINNFRRVSGLLSCVNSAFCYSGDASPTHHFPPPVHHPGASFCAA